uniref:Uncharacterized protein n=1 Tax=Leersia perrieri TaxID=77586 RepID=A0A0D9V5P2_9ORYZ
MRTPVGRTGSFCESCLRWISVGMAGFDRENDSPFGLFFVLF